MDPQVAVVVVSYNTKELLFECIESVFESTKNQNIELVIVDNASEDGSYEAVLKSYPGLKMIRNATNLGFGAACNQGIKATSSNFILLLNSDARLTPQAYQSLCDCLEQNRQCGAAGCRLVDAAGVEVINTRNFLTALNQALELAAITIGSGRLRRTRRPNPDSNLVDCSVDWIDGACLMLRRSPLTSPDYSMSGSSCIQKMKISASGSGNVDGWSVFAGQVRLFIRARRRVGFIRKRCCVDSIRASCSFSASIGAGALLSSTCS